MYHYHRIVRDYLDSQQVDRGLPRQSLATTKFGPYAPGFFSIGHSQKALVSETLVSVNEVIFASDLQGGQHFENVVITQTSRFKLTCEKN